MYIFLLLFVSEAWAYPYDYHLGDLPMQNPDLFEGDILGIESPEVHFYFLVERFSIASSVFDATGKLLVDPSFLDSNTGYWTYWTSISDRTAISYEQLRWPSATIYYIIDDSLPQYDRITLSNVVIPYYERFTCLKFVPRTDQKDYVRFFKGEGCYSHVGRTGGEQPLSLGDGCSPWGTVFHEVGHAIGFLHEQNRSDRDDHIIIHWENIKEGMEDQFKKFNPSENILYNEFEYESIMLYGETAFSKDRKSKTMTAKKEGVRLKEVYEKNYPTKSDFYRVNRMYNCVDKLKE